jgi:predicted methyltransferase
MWRPYKEFNMKLLMTCLLALMVSPVSAADTDVTEEKVKAAIKNERRVEAETARDKNRRPEETLKFFGLKHDMRVLELLPGGGWYTNSLGPVLEEEGKLYVSIGADRAVAAVKDKPGFGSLEMIPFDGSNIIRTEGERRITVPEFSFGVRELDMVLTFRNMHNFTAEGRKYMNEAVFEALKSGGTYGVVDHTRRHMSADYNESWRRMDPVEIIKEVQASGFELVDFSNLHYRADDELLYEVGRKSVSGNTDRFTLLFKKP